MRIFLFFFSALADIGLYLTDAQFPSVDARGSLPLRPPSLG